MSRARTPPAAPAGAATATIRPSSVSASDPGATPRRSAMAERTCAATSRAACNTAPPDIHVWRDADDDPAESMPAVPAGSTTASQPRTVRAICEAMVTKPCPTSATAHVIDATPPDNLTRASESSSNPSEYMRFLNPAATPTPRRTRDASAVRPAPPGRSSQPSPLGGGSGWSTAARMHAATGTAPVSRCPVGSTSPTSRALRTRSSTGSMPSRAASLSICDSWPKHTWTAPKPRMAPQGGLLVRTTVASTKALGTR